MTTLRLIDENLLLSIINASKPVIRPPTHQDLSLSANADKNMNEILNQSPTLENATKYKTELSKYSNYLNNYMDTLQTPSVSASPQSSTTLPPADKESKLLEIVKRAGPREKKRILGILDRLLSPESKLSWNSNLQLVENGVPIQGSNIMDLLKAVTTESKKPLSTPGLSRFIFHLNQLNVPQHTAGSTRTKTMLQTGEVDPSFDPLSSPHGLIRPSKRKRTISPPPRPINTNLSSRIFKWVE